MTRDEMSGQLPMFVQEMLAAPPHAGEGVHDWLFRIGRQLHAHMPALEIVDLLENLVANCGRFVPRSEIVAAVQNSIPCAWQPGRQSQPIIAAQKWPAVNQEQREAIIQGGGGLYDLWENSPVRFEDNASHTEALIDVLFPGNPLLCCGQSNSEFATRTREEWRGRLSKLQLIVPSPMTARSGPTKAGHESEHALSIVGPRWFLVTEFDQGSVDEHAKLLLHLASDAPLTLVVHSGSRSLHGWFPCKEQTEEQLHRFMSRAVSLGACTSTWCRSQFVRMPDGERVNGKRQAVFYFNPEVIAK
jgi:hypothetical protein